MNARGPVRTPVQICVREIQHLGQKSRTGNKVGKKCSHDASDYRPVTAGLLEAHDMYGLYALTEPEYQTRGDSEIQRGTISNTQKPTKNQ